MNQKLPVLQRRTKANAGATVSLVMVALIVGFLSALIGCPTPLDPPFDPVDLQPPADVSRLIAGIGDETVVLSWNDPPDKDFNYVEITWFSNGPCQRYVPAGIGSCTEIGLTNDVEYLFTVKRIFDTSKNDVFTL